MPPAEARHPCSKPVPPFEIRRRIQGLQQALQRAEMEAALIVQRMDLLYFSGTAQSGFLFVPADGDPLLMIRRYFPRARDESSLQHVVEISSARRIAPAVAEAYGRLPGSLGLEYDVLPTRDFEYYRSLLGHPQCRDASPLIHRLRMIKSDWELDRLEQAAGRLDQVFGFIRENLDPAAGEADMGSLAEAFARRMGHAGKVRLRDPRQQRAPWKILKAPAGSDGVPAPVVFGFTFVCQGYHAQETRTLTFPGTPARLLDACRAVDQLQQAVLERAHPGLALAELLTAVRKKAKILGLEEALQGAAERGQEAVKAHGIGLELVEPPLIERHSAWRLEPGMVLTLHLGLRLQSGAPIGDGRMIVVTETGARRMISPKHSVTIAT